MTKFFAAILLFFVAWPSFAADPNGYIAQYECRAGNPNCDVDVVGLTDNTARSCQQTITTATKPTNDWSAIDWSNDVICIQAGDYTSRGTLKLGSSGTSKLYKVLRYMRSGDNNDEPWNQSVTNQARLSAIQTNDQSYWVIHRISLVQRSSIIHFSTNGTASSHLILSHILGEGIGNSSGDDSIIEINSGSDITVQNSVVRNCQVEAGRSYIGIAVGATTRAHIVNNEIYDCAKGISTWFNSVNHGIVVENNDVYASPAFYTDCNGNDDPQGDCSKAKTLIGISSGGASQADASRYIHNRLWGIRWCDTNVSCSGGGSPGYAMGGGYDAPVNWVLEQNNIVMDSGGGLTSSAGPSSSTSHGSIIGNIFYRIRQYNGAKNGGVQFYAASGSGGNNAYEIYFNSFIDIQGSGWIESGGVTNSDIRCNVIINSTPANGVASGSGTQVDNDVYYGTKDSAETNRITRALTVRTNNTGYIIGDVVRPAVDTGWAYLATGPGTSGASAPSFCQSLGCTITDGTVVWEAVRGPYTVRRKLRTVTGGEPVVIPYVLAHSSAPEAGSCPSTTGSRKGIGVSDDLPF